LNPWSVKSVVRESAVIRGRKFLASFAPGHCENREDFGQAGARVGAWNFKIDRSERGL
jgi:hypothetical protein